MATVKRIRLDGTVKETFATERELNGWREKQHMLFDRDEYKAPAGDHDPRQASFLTEGDR